MSTKDPILLQLKKIEGQVAAVQRMYQTKRDCMDIVQQIIAARASLSTVAQKILSEESVRCVRKRGQDEKFAKTIERLFKVT